MMLEFVDDLYRISKPLEKDVLAPWKAADVVLRRSSIDSDFGPFSRRLSHLISLLQIAARAIG